MLFILYRSLQPELLPKMRDMREQLWVFGVESHMVICDTVNFPWFYLCIITVLKGLLFFFLLILTA